MTKRAVSEWSSANPDAAIPPRVKLRIWERCKGRCGLSGKKIMTGDAYDFDHIRALCNGGAHAESNLHVVLRDKHREKTVADVKERVKTERTRQKFLGLYPKSRTPLKSRNTFQSRGF